MPSLVKNEGRIDNATLQKAMWLLIAVALNAVELAIPRIPFLPWLKPGFANIITILWIIRYGFTDALVYTALRIWISGFYFGFSLFTLSLSLSGGMLSTIVMSMLWVSLGRRKLIGTVGMAVMGALFHNAGQLGVVYFVMSRNMSLLGQVPFMLGASVIFGTIVGVFVPIVNKIVDLGGIDVCTKPPGADIRKAVGLTGADVSTNSSGIDIGIRQTAKVVDKLAVVLTFATAVSLMFINNVYVLMSAATIFSLTALVLNPKKPLVILYPLRFYMLFIFILLTHIFFTYGTHIDLLPFITKEGLLASAKQTLRLWCWLQTAHVFKRFKFNELFMSVLYRSFPNKRETLNAGMLALEHFPEIVRISKSTRKKIPLTALLSRPGKALSEYVRDVGGRIAGIVLNASG